VAKPDKEQIDKFIKRAQDDIGDDWENAIKDKILAAAQDSETGIYIILMAVPSTAFSDGVGPEVFYSSEEGKFIGGLNQDVLLEQAEEIEKENPFYTEEEKNNAMAEFIASFMPGLFEAARQMIPLDI